MLGQILGPTTLGRISGAETPNPVEVFGQPFLSRVGLAAGFDKDAEIVEFLAALGFGFVEIGTVTPRPQPGNPRPRLFRDPAGEALFNRMGFNSAGADVVAARLAHAREHLHANFRVGVNVGKNKDTPLEHAHDDYAAAARPFRGLVDFIVLNVSSPNTPGLRSLQTVEALRPLVEALAHETAGWRKKPPLLLKLAPEVDASALGEILPAGESWGIDGWVLTNTLAGTWRVGAEDLPGGWSGKPVRELAAQRLRDARSLTKKPIVSVGGILSPQDAVARRELGAELVEVYAGWVLKGPAFPAQLARALR